MNHPRQAGSLKALVTAVPALAALLVLLTPLLGACGKSSKELTLLNVSYDPTRELYGEINPLFIEHWKQQTGQSVSIKQSHGGAGKQTRAVLEGLEADVVTFALAHDIDILHERASLLPKDWQAKLPHRSAPYSSTIVFLVRAGNPKQIKDYGDLVRDGVEVITPNPKTSGGARLNYLAAYGYAQRQKPGDEAHARDFMARLYKNVPVLDSGARGSTTTFVERGIGDVLITWENEGLLAVDKLGKGKVELVVPPRSILAEPPVAVVEKYAAKHGTEAVARAYLEFLYTPAAQRIAAKHYYRPSDEAALAESAARFAKLELFAVEELGGWQAVHDAHFADGAAFDQIYTQKKR
ncbi:MAG: sulfate ABC transporter substrate-binding protein [Polyangiaceae bacterium]|nr:sulfate ABC transporter substrate-binding protein [Polyangiaceae bacterium]MCW5788920.1 sulfate ABC transporter substrate-binding protein [Polyangiaceae bacterium]